MTRLAVTLHAQGSFHALRGEWRQAAALFQRAARLDPSNVATKHALALALMAQGKLREGLPLYAERWRVPGLGVMRPKLPCPEWNGEPLEGKSIIVWPEQGLGDQIMFVRYAPRLKALGADVTLVSLPPLARLFEGLGVRSLAAQGTLEFPDPDYWVMIGDLPLRLGETTITGEPYLAANVVPSRTKGVGLVRRGNPAHPNDENRSLPDQVSIPFPTISLAPSDTGARDMQDTANVIAGLGAVVTVDTSVAHLAGALGTPVYILLPAHGPDWRWGEHGSRTPWYDSARLVRQKRAGSWTTELEAIRSDLAQGLGLSS